MVLFVSHSELRFRLRKPDELLKRFSGRQIEQNVRLERLSRFFFHSKYLRKGDRRVSDRPGWDREQWLELRAKIDGLQLIVDTFIGATTERAYWRQRFSDILEELRMHNAHAATIDALRQALDQLSDEQ